MNNTQERGKIIPIRQAVQVDCVTVREWGKSRAWAHAELNRQCNLQQASGGKVLAFSPCRLARYMQAWDAGSD